VTRGIEAGGSGTNSAHLGLRMDLGYMLGFKKTQSSD
jgi:hypothetical protein